MRVLAGRYELVRFVGRGGMGEVWEAHDRTIDRRVAVKLLPHQRGNAAETALFFREARTAGALHHPGVVTIHDLGQDDADGSLFLVMEYLNGRDLSTVLREDGTPSVATAAEWAAQAAAALKAAHDAGIVHRDLKPANLMIASENRLVILDFGIARFIEATHKSSKVMGTLAYMAPERFHGQPGDTRSDLYALGCVLYELLTGRVPFEADGPVAMMKAHLDQPPPRPAQQRPEISAALDDLVIALLAKAAEDRPTSALAVLEMLRGQAANDEDERVRYNDEVPQIADLPTQTATQDAPGPGPDPADGSHDESQAESGPQAGNKAHPPNIARRRFIWIAAAGVAATAAGLAAPPLVSALRKQLEMQWPLHHPMGYNAPVAAQGAVYAGRRDGVILALDAATGAQKWALEVGGTPTDLAVAGAGLYACNLDGSLYAVDVATGARRWTYDTAGALLSPPVPAGGTVFLCSRDHNLHAVDAATGSRRWIYSAGPSDSSPSVANGVVYIATSAETKATLHAIDAATGTKKWTIGIDASIEATPAVVDGVIYIGDQDHSLYALDAVTGATKWTSYVRSSYFSSAAVATGVVYLSGANGALRAFNASTGVQKWSYPIDAGASETSTPVVVNGVVYIVGTNVLHAVEALNGAKKWTVSTDKRGVFSQPVVADSVVYVSGGYGDDSLHAFDAVSGEPL